jgi:hypothetical protein
MHQFTAACFQLIIKLFKLIIGHFGLRNFFSPAFEAPTHRPTILHVSDANHSG